MLKKNEAIKIDYRIFIIIHYFLYLYKTFRTHDRFNNIFFSDRLPLPVGPEQILHVHVSFPQGCTDKATGHQSAEQTFRHDLLQHTFIDSFVMSAQKHQFVFFRKIFSFIYYFYYFTIKFWNIRI